MRENDPSGVVCKNERGFELFEIKLVILFILHEGFVCLRDVVVEVAAIDRIMSIIDLTDCYCFILIQ